MKRSILNSKSCPLLAVLLTLILAQATCLGQGKTTIGPNGTLLPPGRQEQATTKAKAKLKVKTPKQSTTKAASGAKLKLPQNAARSSAASSVLTRLQANPDQVRQLAKEKVKEVGKTKLAAKKQGPSKATGKSTAKLNGTKKLSAGATKKHPNNAARRPQAYADKSGIRKPTGTKLSSKNSAKKLSGTASSQRPGSGPRRPAAYADKSPVRKPTAKSVLNGQAKKSSVKKSTAKTATTRKPTRKLASSTPKSPTKAPTKSKGYKLGKAAGGAAAIGLVGGAAAGYSDAKKLRDSGKISKSQYKKMQTKNTVDTAGAALALKKLNVTSVVLNDVVGTDPITLGAQAFGDLLNGTDNAKQSLKNVKHAWNGSLTKQAFTDPKAAGKRVADGVKETGKKIGDAAKKTGKAIESGAKKAGDGVKKFVGGIFKKKKKKK